MGLRMHLTVLENLMECFFLEKLARFFPVTFNRLSPEKIHLILECEEFAVFASQVCHMIPTVGLADGI